MDRGIPSDQLTPNRTLVAVYEGYDAERDRPLYAVKPESFRAVMEGYACGTCLAYFGMYSPKCPVCGEDTGPSQAVKAWWTDYPDQVK